MSVSLRLEGKGIEFMVIIVGAELPVLLRAWPGEPQQNRETAKSRHLPAGGQALA